MPPATDAYRSAFQSSVRERQSNASGAPSSPASLAPTSFKAASFNQLLVSNARSREISSFVDSYAVAMLTAPENPPPVWPAILVSLLHNISMGAALMVWIDVCRSAFEDTSVPVVPAGADEPVNTSPQTLYGWLLAMNAICELMTSQLVGAVSDRYGRRALQLSAQIGQLVDYAAAGLCLPGVGVLSWTVPMDSVIPLLFLTRGIAGMMGNFRVSLQSYTTDISSAEDCPMNLGYIGAGIVVGMCIGSGVVALTFHLGMSYRLCFIFAGCCNIANMVLVIFFWRDVAPKRSFTLADLNPFSGIPMLFASPVMTTYSLLIFLSAFALNIYTSTLAFYCGRFLDMSKPTFSALGAEWALMSAVALTAIQPILVQRFGETKTLQLSFFAMTVFYLLFSMLDKTNWEMAFPVMLLFSLSSIAYPLSVGLAAREVNPDEQGRLQGAVSIVETTGKILAPLLASSVLIPMYEGPDQFNGMVYLVAGVIVAPGIVLAGGLASMTTRVSGEVKGRQSVDALSYDTAQDRRRAQSTASVKVTTPSGETMDVELPVSSDGRRPTY